MNFEPIPVTVITGFLGAGKTSLLNRLLRHPALAGAAVIVNEFGDVSIDHLLVEQANDGVIQLADGCLCCTVRGDLVDTIADLIDRMQTGKVAPITRIVIETTGLADPVPVLQALTGHPVLVQAIRLDGVVTLVDAVNGQSTLDAHAESVRQVAVADRLVLAKLDLAPAGDVSALTARLAALNPAASQIDSTGALDDPQKLLSAGLYDPATRSADVARWLADAPSHDHGHDHDHTHDHHHHHHADDDGHHHHHHHESHHDARIKRFSLVHPRPIAWTTMEMFLDLVRSQQGENLLRLKGVVEIAEDPSRPVVVHAVQKLLSTPQRLPAWPDDVRGTRMVLIGFDLDEEYVRRLFSAFTGAPAIDTPDPAALADNPLAIPGFSAR